MAYDDDYRFQPDPVLHYRFPPTASTPSRSRTRIYRGREDFVYRLSIGELPFVTSVFPLGGPARAKTAVQVSGWNLPTGSVTMDATGAGPGTAMLTVRRGAIGVEPRALRRRRLRDVVEREPNNAPNEAGEARACR